MPGRHVTDQQMRIFMTLRQTHTVSVSAAKAGISQATGYRIQADPTLPSQKQKSRSRRRRDPLAEIFDKIELITMDIDEFMDDEAPLSNSSTHTV